MGWAQQEFETMDIDDPSLNRRAVLLAQRLGQKPGASIPAACENWTQTAAAYRFLRNEQVSWDDLMGAHWKASQARMREHEAVLWIQDTAQLDYNGQAMQGLGPLSYEAQRGLYLHPTYVVTPQREPLGGSTPGRGRANSSGATRPGPVFWRAFSGWRATSASLSRHAICPARGTCAWASASPTSWRCW